MSVFISYRRQDTAHAAGRFYDVLARHFGKQSVFKDVDSIAPGSDFRTEIDKAVSKANIMLVLIGSQFNPTIDRQRRLDDENDLVRVEIESALRRNIPVVPVITKDGALPKDQELPTSLRQLVYNQALWLRPDPDFHNDCERICAHIEQVVDRQDRVHRVRAWGRNAFMLIVDFGRKLAISPKPLALCGATLIAVWLTIAAIRGCRSADSRPTDTGEIMQRGAIPLSRSNEGKLIANGIVQFELDVIRFTTEHRTREEQYTVEIDGVPHIRTRTVPYTVSVPSTYTETFQSIRHPETKPFPLNGATYYEVTLYLPTGKEVTVIAVDRPREGLFIPEGESQSLPSLPVPEAVNEDPAGTDDAKPSADGVDASQESLDDMFGD